MGKTPGMSVVNHMTASNHILHHHHHQQQQYSNHNQHQQQQQQRRRSRGAKLFRNNKKDWIPSTKLGRLVKNGFVTTLDEIFHHNLPITGIFSQSAKLINTKILVRSPDEKKVSWVDPIVSGSRCHR